jgi:hypothetical protein
MKKASELGSALGDLHGFHGFSAQTILLTKGTHCHIAKQ